MKVLNTKLSSSRSAIKWLAHATRNIAQLARHTGPAAGNSGHREVVEGHEMGVLNRLCKNGKLEVPWQVPG